MFAQRLWVLPARRPEWATAARDPKMSVTPKIAAPDSHPAVPTAAPRLRPAQLRAIAIMLVIAAWAIARWPLVSLPLVLWQPDSVGYFSVSMDILSGVPPDLTIRPPLYPLAVAAWAAGDGGPILILAQSVAMLAAALALLWALADALAGRWLLAASGLCLLMLSPWGMEHEISIMTESLMASLMIVAVAFALLGLQRRRAVVCFLIAGFACGLAILTKPAALGLLAAFVLFAAILAAQKRWLAAGLLIGLPATCIGALAFYNGITNDVWKYSNFTGRNLLSATCTTADIAAEPPGAGRDGLLALHRLVPQGDWQALSSWRPYSVADASMRWFDRCGYEFFGHMTPEEFEQTGMRFFRQNPPGYAHRILMIAAAYHTRVYKQRKFITLISKGNLPVLADTQQIMKRHCGTDSQLPEAGKAAA